MHFVRSGTPTSFTYHICKSLVKISKNNKWSTTTDESGFREQPPCRHPRSLNPDWSLNPDSFSSRKFPFQKSEASKSRPASKYQFSKYRLCCNGDAVSYRVRHSILSSLKLIVVDSWWGFGVAGWGWGWHRGWRGWSHAHSSHAGLGRRHHCHDPHPGLYTKSTCVQRSNSISVHGQG